jgi:putative hydrolase of the HAD superfamily
MIKAITFDLWTTIIEPIDYRGSRIEYLRRFLKDKGYSFEKEELWSAYSYSLERFSSVWQNDHRHMPSAQRLGYMLQKLGVNLSGVDIARVVAYFEEAVLHALPPLVMGAESVLNSLHGSYELGLICDSGMSPGRVMRRVLARLEILQYLGATVFSDELGCTKPDLRMFECTLGRLGVDASHAMHVGDLLRTDVAGAKAAGMQTIWFNRNGAQSSDGAIIPDYEVRDLAEVLSIVSGEKGG